MHDQLDLMAYAHALGRYEASWRFAGTELRQALAFRAISAAWDTYRRDAGPGEVGPAHEEHADGAGVLRVNDPRRDAVLLWLLDHGASDIADAAGTLVRMVAATRRFSADEHALLHEARDAVSSAQEGPLTRRIGEAASGVQVTAPLMSVARAVDRLRESEAFVEGTGEDVFLPVPSGMFSHYVPAAPGATWALNLALLTPSSPLAAVLPVPGLATRMVFRLDAEPEECAADLVKAVTAALIAAADMIKRAHAELARGRAALAHLSRNSRAFEAWLLIVALGALTRVQLTRALGLSRAGGDIQARALADARLIKLRPGGWIDWVEDPTTKMEVTAANCAADPLSLAVADFNESLAALDRLLARTSR